MRNNNANKTVGVFSDKTLSTAIRDRIVSLVSKKGGDTRSWTGTMTDLTRALKSIGGKTKVVIPTSPSVMRKIVNNTVYGLRRSGVGVTFLRTSDHMRKRVVEFVQR